MRLLYGRDLAEYNGQVRDQGGGTGAKAGLCYRVTMKGDGGGNIRGHSRNVSPARAARQGVGLGFTTPGRS